MALGSHRLSCTAATCALLMFCRAFGALNDPFPMGYSMQNFGTIVWDNSFSGMGSSLPASVMPDSPLVAISLSAVDYYGAMDNHSDRSIRQGEIAFAGSCKGFSLKASYTHFNALDIYFEQKGHLSVGTSLLPLVRAGAQVSAARLGISHTNQSQEILTAGASIFVPLRYACLATTISNIPVYTSYNRDFDSAPLLAFGVHTKPHRFGAQGVVIQTHLEREPEISLRLGEEFWLGKWIAFNAGLCSSPFMVSFGITVAIKATGISAAFVHHPQLGLSKGITGTHILRLTK